MTDLDSELRRLRAEGLVLPRDQRRAVKSYAETVQTARQMHEWAGRDLNGISARLGRTVHSDDLSSPQVRAIKEENDALARAMAERRGISYAGQRGIDGHRRVAARRAAQDARWGSPHPARFAGTGSSGMRRTGSVQKEAVIGGGGSSVGGDVMNALPRFYDPLEYWDLSGLPWNVADEGHRHKLHKWLRLYYATHYLVPILVDIFTRFPLVGMELQHEDKQLRMIYEDMFLDQLQYEDFLVGLGREVWLVGEAFPLGQFDEELGIWEHEELINPEDVVIDNFPLLDSQQLKIVPPDYLRRIAQTKQPAREWYMLQQNYADLIPYLRKGEHIPMSPVVLRQVANKMNNWDDHGTPILLRGLRTLLHEEKLLASQDAIAERLYSPFLLAKLGIQDMGDGLPPWLPTPDELQSVRDDIDIAMASDFRVLVHHFGLELESVFGREQMPRLGDDFDRIERRLMQVFGVNPSLLSAGSNAQPYASSALQAEFMNQILRTFQKQLKEHFRARAAVVAEAQGHYAYERKGSTRVPIYENVVEWTEDGEKQIVRKRKYTYPELDFACLAYGTRVQTPDGPVDVERLVEGDVVIAWDLGDDAPVERRVTHSYNNGTHPVYHVCTHLGREIRTTQEHPFLTQRGWIAAEDLTIGDKLRIGTDYTPSVPSRISERDARFLGLIVGDGCLSACEDGGVPMLANYDQEILVWTDHYVSGYGCSLKSNPDECAKDITQTHGRRVNPNPIKQFLRDHGVSGETAKTKRVPKSVWAGGPGVWSAFLSGYLDADGTVATNRVVSWTSINHELLKDCQTLLAYLGIRSDLIHHGDWHVDPQGHRRWLDKWMLSVQSRASLERCQRFLDPLCIRKRAMSTRVGVVDERRRLTPEQAYEIKELIALKRNRLDGPTYKEIGVRYGISSSTIWRAVQGEYDELYTSWVDPQWDEVRSVTLEAEQPTWSLGIEGDHTHITEGLVTHNTFDLRDEATERQFLTGLRALGIPIPDEKMMIGIQWKDQDYTKIFNDEIKKKTIDQQQAKMDTYIALVIKGLPVPIDLKAEVESVLAGGTGPTQMPGEAGEAGGPGGAPPGGAPGAGGEGTVMPPPPPGLLGPGPGSAPPGGGPPPTAPNSPQRGTVPEASNERRPGLTYNAAKEALAGRPVDMMSMEQLAETTQDWPEAWRRRAADVWHNLNGDSVEDDAKVAAHVEESTETEDPDTWVLSSNQQIVEENGEPVILEGKKARMAFEFNEPSKRYSLIDPLAETPKDEPDTEIST